jgi:hypothetical protein
VLLAVCLIARPADGASRGRRAGALLGGTVAGFAVLAGPFALAAPSAFVHQTLLDQISRVGSAVPASLRLAHLTGLIDLIGRNGGFALPGASTHSLFAMGAEASTRTVSVGWPAFAAALVAVAVIAAGYLTGWRGRTPLEWFALVTTVLAALAILRYPAFFYHYPDFPAPWLAITAGVAVGSLACLIRGSAPAAQLARRVIGAAVAVVILAVAASEALELSQAQVPATPAAVSQLVPSGSCLIADQVSFAIAADRFPAPSAGCPDVIDSLAVTLSLSGGVSPQGGAGRHPQVIVGWEKIFGQARYVWLQGGSSARIPWTLGGASSAPSPLSPWFAAHFQKIASFPGYGQSTLYVRDH